MINDLEMTIATNNNEHSYFLCAMSGNGFKNFMTEKTKRYRKRILIKGGPGTGKSTLMKKIIENAKEKGIICDEIYCSSDPASLDGVFIDKLSLCIVDATAPHIIEPIYPGSNDITFDLSRFWDSHKLFDNERKIIEINIKKTEHYKNAYFLLSSLLSLHRLYYGIFDGCIKKDEIRDSINYIFANIREDNTYECERKLCSAISTKGFIHLDSYDRIKSNHFVIEDKYDVSAYYLKNAFSHLKKNNTGFIYAPDVLDTDLCEALYIPSSNITVTVNSDIIGNKIIDTDDFINKTEYSKVKEKLKRIKKPINKIAEEISNELSLVSEYHGSLEKIYSSAMNFDEKEIAQAELINKIL